VNRGDNSSMKKHSKKGRLPCIFFLSHSKKEKIKKEKGRRDLIHDLFFCNTEALFF